MDILTNKQYLSYNYLNRYSSVPIYYNTIDKKYQTGIGKNMLKNATYTRHITKPSDTLDYLSLKYYNDPTYWWVIAYFNDIQDSYINLYKYYKNILIPNISEIQFGDR
jgi:hypothetical protein